MDSPSCRKVQKLVRSLEKDVVRARNLFEAGEGKRLREVVALLVGGGGEGKGVIEKVENAIKEGIESSTIPPNFSTLTSSSLLLELYSMACSSHVRLGMTTSMGTKKYCDKVLGMKGGEGNVDALTARGEALIREEEYEEAVRVFSDAFEKSGRSSQDVSLPSLSGGTSM